jgi:hypothetical protein
VCARIRRYQSSDMDYSHSRSLALWFYLYTNMQISANSFHVFPCGGELEYLHRSSASRRKRRKGNAVRGGITGPHWGTYIRGPGSPAWVLDARLTTLLCKKNILAKYKEVKLDFLGKAMAQKGLFCR